MIPVETVPEIWEEGMGARSGRGEFKCCIFDILQELLSMLQCTYTHHNNNNNNKHRFWYA
jgi:hypothetical protein